MLIQPYVTEELWSPEKLQLPERSRLYHLPPIGIGTPFVESLTSYIARLAESHSVFPGVLISRELASLVKKLYVTRGAMRGLHELFNRAHALNGTESMAGDWVEALEKLTLRRDLRFLTLHNCASTLPVRGLFRIYKAWCPACYQNWCLSGQVVYEPLLWAIEAVKACPRHQQPLCSYCSHCHKQLPILEWRSRSGYCSICGKWLGNFGDSFERGTLSLEELTRQSWAANTIGELIIAVAGFSSPLPRENVAKALRTVTNLVTTGNIAAFASHLGIPRNTLWMWYGGKALPQLDVLLKICYCLEISLLEFLIPEKLEAKSLKLSFQKTPEQSHNKRVSPKSFDSDRVEEVLVATLTSSKEPPPTMNEVAQQLCYDRRTISRHFPELCHAISTRTQSYKRALRLRELEQSCQEVQQIALELLNRGVHPSEARVSKLMSKPGYFRYKSVRAALQKVQCRARL